MKSMLLFGAATALLSLSLTAADSNPKNDINAAAKKLADSANYSWRTTIVVPEDSPFKPGPTDGKVEKDGFTWFTMSFGDNETKAVLKGDKGAATTPEGDWQSLSELDNAEGPARFMGILLRNFKSPAAQATQLASFAKELKHDGDTYSADLTEEGAKTLLTFRPRGGGEGPSVTNPKGSVKFWLKDGALTKYEFKVKGTVSFNGNDFDQDRTTTVVIKDVGTTKVTVPDEAKKKLT
jgi:hypothetical protein